MILIFHNAKYNKVLIIISSLYLLYIILSISEKQHQEIIYLSKLNYGLK